MIFFFRSFIRLLPHAFLALLLSIFFPTFISAFFSSISLNSVLALFGNSCGFHIFYYPIIIWCHQLISNKRCIIILLNNFPNVNKLYIVLYLNKLKPRITILHLLCATIAPKIGGIIEINVFI